MYTAEFGFLAVILALASTPARAAALTRGQIRAALKRAGRARHVEQDVERLRQIFRAEHMRLPNLVEQAMGRQLTALLGQLEATCAAEQNLATAVEEAFAQHPDAETLHQHGIVSPSRGFRTGGLAYSTVTSSRSRLACW